MIPVHTPYIRSFFHVRALKTVDLFFFIFQRFHKKLPPFSPVDPVVSFLCVFRGPVCVSFLVFFLHFVRCLAQTPPLANTKTHFFLLLPPPRALRPPVFTPALTFVLVSPTSSLLLPLASGVFLFPNFPFFYPSSMSYPRNLFKVPPLRRPFVFLNQNMCYIFSGPDDKSPLFARQKFHITFSVP